MTTIKKGQKITFIDDVEVLTDIFTDYWIGENPLELAEYLCGRTFKVTSIPYGVLHTYGIRINGRYTKAWVYPNIAFKENYDGNKV